MDKLRIRVKSYDQRLIDNSCRQIIDVLQRSQAKSVGPIPLPTEIKKYTVNRSTFIYKNSREQFEIRIHKRIIDILDPGQKLMEALAELTMPAGVFVEVNQG